MSEGRLRRMRGTAMRQRRPAPSTRDDRRRPLPAKHGHAARPQATREYQSDTSSKQCPRSSISPRSGAGSPRPPPLLIDNRSLHISRTARRAHALDSAERTPQACLGRARPSGSRAGSRLERAGAVGRWEGHASALLSTLFPLVRGFGGRQHPVATTPISRADRQCCWPLYHWGLKDTTSAAP